MKLLNLNEFKGYLDSLKVTRSIKTIQLHHTYEPSYDNFNGSNHLTMQKNMQTYHIKTNGWSDIGQHFTIFPDGKICTGRSINSSPAGIKGANANSICIECIGNFDAGGDEMTEEQKTSIIGVTKMLLDRFNLKANASVIYHAWWTASGKSLGTYVRGKSAKTCPGTNFFGGNTKEAYTKNLMPLIENYGKEETIMYNTFNDVPDWAKPTIKKLIDKGFLNGDSNGNLNLSLDMIRILVINDRAGLYGKE